MKDKTTTTFPTMGTQASTFVNRSAERGPTQTSVLKSGNAKGGMIEAVLHGYRQQIPERLGHKGAVQATYVYPNAEESAATGRNVYTVPSKAGLGDFYLHQNRGA
ncbi:MULTISPECIES: hypothetical protein [Nonomuraea]|uniref:hypothetical protein n=1 Tax=Nonomuraea TaxID=83681 RepID=UPI0012FB4F2E|nr:hypothetical protein [Nonomuraea typhae]